MKKNWKSLFILAIGALAFSNCEDVPEPYNLPNIGANGDGEVPPTEINYIYKETVGTESLSSPYPYVDSYTSWTKEGSGASTVTYSGTKATVRSSGLSSNNAKNYDGSGPNVVFFGVAPASFVINKISLTSTQTKLRLNFGASSSVNVDNSGSYDNSFDINKFTVSLSGDGNTWVPITYTKDNGDESTPYWIYATADFTLKEAVGELYIKFESSVSSAIRLDDITLIEGEGGQEVTLVGGTVPPEDATPITIADLIGKMTTEGNIIDAATNRCFEAVVQSNVENGNYTTNQLCVAEEGATQAKQGIILYGSQADPKTLGLTQGDKVKITLIAGKAKAQLYKGMNEVTGGKDETWCNIEKIGTANITPVVVGTSDLANLIDYQGMTVTVNNASTSETSTWGSGTHTFTSGGVQFTVYANSACTFANNSIDNTKTGSIAGVVTVYNNVAQIAPRTAADIAAFNGETTGGDDEDDNTDPSDADLVMTIDDFINNTSGSVSLTTNNYGSQAVSDESTWYHWTANGIEYRGARICRAPENNGGGIQLQGNASDNAKQGFFTNVTSISNIKKIIVTMRTVSTASYAPDFSLYVGTSALPTTNKITPSTNKTTGSDFNTYVYTYDLSGNSYNYFTVKNDLVGAVYIDKVEIYKN